MRHRVARKIAKRIQAGAPCPRVNGRGYREGTRLAAANKLHPTQRPLYVDVLTRDMAYGKGLAETLYETWWGYRELLRLLRVRS